MQNKFLVLIKKHESYLKRMDRIFNNIGRVKVLLVLFVGFIGYLLFSKQFPLEIILLFSLTLIVLVGLWIYHAKLGNKMDYSKGMIAICQQHIDRITGKWAAFRDIGSEFVDDDHAYACDLDVVGKKSLFQFLNTTQTWHGRQAFAKDLLRPAYKRSELQKRQEAIAELSTDIEFSGKMQYYLSKTGMESSAKLNETLHNKTEFIKSKVFKILLTYVPMLTLLFIIVGLALQLTTLYFLGAFMAGMQAIVWGLGAAKIQNYLGIMTQLPHKLDAYAEAIDILTSKNFSCEPLKQIQKKLNEAAQAIKDLNKIANRISIKHNFLIYFIVNIFLLWDYGCVFAFQGWKRKYADRTEEWFSAIGEFESLLCLSHLPNVCDTTCLPTLNEKGCSMEAQALGHPLLLNESRVNNEFNFNDTILIISGSNMSGKTTFLRTVGVNIVLARSGGFVCAEKMCVSLFDIVTSMRITDDLNEGISTFYAELKRIKKIIDFAKEHAGMMFLIDEIFKGTNSVDRLTGAKTVIEKLNDLGAVGLVSTHDLELCELTSYYKRMKNYSFSEHYEEDRICFPYKIKQGKSNTTNAKYLMNMVGIFD
ncbi:MAG: DNA mismatch repair protein MutS [Peptococcaceae bacterium]|nr:DNA mismatch repair protein MutS [Peptococcaceae bacterium]